MKLKQKTNLLVHGQVGLSSVQFSRSIVSGSLWPQFPESTQTHVHWVGDAIQPSHLLLPLLPLPSIFPSIRVFSNESALRIRWPKYWSFSFPILSNTFSSRTPLGSPLGWTGWISLQSKGLSRVFSNTTLLALSLLYSPTLTSIHDYWKNHSLD